MRYFISLLAFAAFLSCSNERTPEIEFAGNAAEQKIDILFDGAHFTTFVYSDELEKQVLYPIRTASGKIITRGYPLDARPFERVDHPHHYGMWFNHGDVNGIDFWNTIGFKPRDPEKYGKIRFMGVKEETPRKGRLTVLADWIDHADSVLLKEETIYLFSGNDTLRKIERIITLTALTDVVLGESKEGMFGIRMAREFEEPTDKPTRYTDENGLESAEPFVYYEGINGVYRDADGRVGPEVWGQRSPWVAVRAELEGERVTVAIFDHRSNPNYPGWSHARGYGLFALNNLGGSSMDKTSDPTEIEIKEGEKISFRYLAVIGGDLTDEQLNEIATDFR